MFDHDFIVPLLIFSVPIVAIVGGITAGIVKTISRHRMMELAARERIAAIERGVDPSKLPPVPEMHGGHRGDGFESFNYNPLNRAQGLMIGGLVTLAAGIGVGVFLNLVSDERGVWAVGLIPGTVGVALLLSALLVWPRGGSGPTPPMR
jgi:uncharacterized protein DUF6249